MAEIKITQANFSSEVLNSDIPVLVDFWAPWCGPCKMLGPVIAAVADKYEGKVKVGKVNVDEEMFLAQQFRVASIPTVILFKEGKAVATNVGLCPQSQIEAMFK